MNVYDNKEENDENIYDIDKYTIDDIKKIFGIENIDVSVSNIYVTQLIIDKSATLINQHKNNNKLQEFILQCKEKILDYINNIESNQFLDAQQAVIANVTSANVNSLKNTNTIFTTIYINSGFRTNSYPLYDFVDSREACNKPEIEDIKWRCKGKVTGKPGIIEMCCSPEMQEYLNVLDNQQMAYQQQLNEEIISFQGLNNNAGVEIENEDFNNTTNIANELDTININNYSIECLNEPQVCRSGNIELSSNFNAILTTTIKNVIELKVNSYNIPMTWHNIAYEYGTNFFQLKFICKNKLKKLKGGFSAQNLSDYLEDIFLNPDGIINILIPEGFYENTEEEEIDYLIDKYEQFTIRVNNFCKVFNYLCDPRLNYYHNNNIEYFLYFYYQSYGLDVKNVRIPKFINILNKSVYNKIICYNKTAKAKLNTFPFFYYNPINKTVGITYYEYNKSDAIANILQFVWYEPNRSSQSGSFTNSYSNHNLGIKLGFQTLHTFLFNYVDTRPRCRGIVTGVPGVIIAECDIEIIEIYSYLIENITLNPIKLSVSYNKNANINFFWINTHAPGTFNLQLTKQLLLYVDEYSDTSVHDSFIINESSYESLVVDSKVIEQKYYNQLYKNCECNNTIEFYNKRYESKERVVDPFPTNTTNATVYSINSRIRAKMINTHKYKINTANIFCAITIPFDSPYGNTINLNSSSLGKNHKLLNRKYFGAIDISHIKLILYTAEGYVINLKGSEWNIAFIAERLYRPVTD